MVPTFATGWNAPTLASQQAVVPQPIRQYGYEHQILQNLAKGVEEQLRYDPSSATPTRDGRVTVTGNLPQFLRYVENRVRRVPD